MDIVPTVATTLQHLLANHLDELARHGGLVVRQRKFTGQALLRMLVITLLHKPDASNWQAVVVLYRVRWQIELLFKLWKSHNGLAPFRRARTALACLALFDAKLLGLLLATAWRDGQRSLPKASRLLREALKDLLLTLEDRVALVEGLRQLQGLLPRVARVKARKKDPRHAQLLDAPELLQWLSA